MFSFTPDLPIASILEVTLAGLLLATLVYCAVLERRLAGLRKDHASLKNTIRTLNQSIAAAQQSLGDLRGAAEDADKTLGRTIRTARGLADELTVLASNGERAAKRPEAPRAAPAPVRAAPPPVRAAAAPARTAPVARPAPTSPAPREAARAVR